MSAFFAISQCYTLKWFMSLFFCGYFHRYVILEAPHWQWHSWQHANASSEFTGDFIPTYLKSKIGAYVSTWSGVLGPCNKIEEHLLSLMSWAEKMVKEKWVLTRHAGSGEAREAISRLEIKQESCAIAKMCAMHNPTICTWMVVCVCVCLKLESPFELSSTDCWAVQAKIRQKRPSRWP